MSTTRLLGIHVPNDLHSAAHMTAKRQGKTLVDWLTPIICENLDPETANIFLSSDALWNEHFRSINMPTVVDFSDEALEPFPAPAAATHWWHVDGILIEQNGDSTSGTRVASGATAQDAADSILAACTTARGGTWRWATPPTIVRHANHRDDNCPVCTRSFASTPISSYSYNPEQNHED